MQSLVSDESFARARDLLRQAARAGEVICPQSVEHRGETLHGRDWEEIIKLGFELSLGIGFADMESVVDAEIYAAAQEFLGLEPGPLWEEAFDNDPHAGLDEIFAGGLAINAYFPPDDQRRAEVDHEKGKEATLQAAYEAARAKTLTFDEQVELEFDQMLRWKLGPLYDADDFARMLDERQQLLVSEWLSDIEDFEPGSKLDRFMAFSVRKTKIEHLVNRFPELRERPKEFVASDALRTKPSLRYPPLLRSALIHTPGRKAKRGDGYDIMHLTHGLARCDIVTADSGMTQLVTNFGLVPEGCVIVRYADIDGLCGAVETAIEARR